METVVTVSLVFKSKFPDQDNEGLLYDIKSRLAAAFDDYCVDLDHVEINKYQDNHERRGNHDCARCNQLYQGAPTVPVTNN